jgi:hypothetical protein
MTGLYTLLQKELQRFIKVGFQTVAAPWSRRCSIC